MNVEQELALWLDANIREGKKNKARDTRAVLLHYGFGDIAWPTLEQIGEQLSIGTRERVRQVLNSTFKTKASIESFPVLRAAFQEIRQIEFESIPLIRNKLVSVGVISPSTRIRSLLNLGSDLNAVDDYDFVDHELSKLSRSEAEFDEKTFLGTRSAIEALRGAYKKAKTLPGQLGLASREYLYDEIGSEAAEKIWRFMELSGEVEFIQHDDQQWFIFEDRDNTLVNNCGKICSLSAENDVQALAEALSNAFSRRTHKDKYEYPSSEIVRKWIYQSKWFEVTDGAARFLGAPEPLTDIEEAVVDYLTGKGAVKYHPLEEHLLGLNFTKSTVYKAVKASPLVYVDKSDARKTHTYTLISELQSSSNSSVDPNTRYRSFSNRLKILLTTGGTNEPREVLKRREQSILREWIFGDNLTEKCAICGKEFSVNALRTAHKKKRAICTESEKTDPQVVFPLCVFGCDYLYESGMVRIKNGKAVSTCKAPEQTADASAAKAVDGNAIDDRWLEGKASYFGAD